MPENYFARYLPLLFQVLVAVGIAIGMVTLSWVLGKHKYNRAKMSPYECGMEPIGDTQGRFSVKFYLVAMLFILFDVEAVFLYPWAIISARPEDVRLLGDAGVCRSHSRSASSISGRRASSTGTKPEAFEPSGFRHS